VHDVLANLRYALRMLRKAPVVTIVAVVSLGFGIATNTTTFSISKAFLFETFRWPEPERVVVVFEHSLAGSEDHNVAAGNYLDWRESSTRLEALEAYGVRVANLSGGDRPRKVDVVEATPGLLHLVGREPAIGRDFLPEEARSKGERVAIATASFYRDLFASNPASLGESFVLDGVPHTLIGVLPDDFDFIPANVDVFRPVDLADQRHEREDRSLFVLGRLADGVSFDEAAAELATIARRLEEENPDTNRGFGVHVQSLRDLFPGETDTKLQYIFLTVAGFVLLIACANLVNLFLARADARQTELAVRSALGGGRLDVARQVMLESLLVALIGGVAGIGLSVWGVQQLAGIMPAELPSVFVPKLDAAVLAYGVAVSLLAGLLLGAAPALQAAGVRPAAVLGETSRGGTGSKRRRRIRSAFIVAETAAALALLTTAGVLSDTFSDLVRENGALQVDGVLTLDLTADEHRFPSDDEAVGFFEEVQRRLAELPGVESTTALAFLPRGQAFGSTRVTIDGRPLPEDLSEAPEAGWQVASPGFFATLGVPIRQGRSVEIGDRAEGAPVVVVNESFVRRYLSDEQPLGRRITVFGRSREIVGVAADFMQTRIIAEQGIVPALYLPLPQHPIRTLSLAARLAGDGDPMAMADAARAAVWAVDPEQPVSRVQTLRQSIETSLSGPVAIANILRTMGALAVILSAIGMYGLIAYDVARRRREIGIHMALGAAPRKVIARVTRQGVAITAVGLAIGMPLAWGMLRAIESALQGIVPVDFSSVLVICAILVGVACVASWLPALKASRIRPAAVLQLE
jgi:predicted permease